MGDATTKHFFKIWSCSLRQGPCTAASTFRTDEHTCWKDHQAQASHRWFKLWQATFVWTYAQSICRTRLWPSQRSTQWWIPYLWIPWYWLKMWTHLLLDPEICIMAWAGADCWIVWMVSRPRKEQVSSAIDVTLACMLDIDRVTHQSFLWPQIQLKFWMVQFCVQEGQSTCPCNWSGRIRV